MSNAVTELLAAVEAGTGVPAGVFADAVTLDATVPMWRMTLRGSDAVRAKFAVWFADPGRFEDLDRTPVPGGEIVRYTLSWVENGIPFAASQAHFLEIDATGKISADHFFCGGRWGAGRLAVMEEAARVSA